MIKAYLKGIVRTGGKGTLGVGLEMFRLDTDEEIELTEEETEVVDEVAEKDKPTTAIMRIYENIGQDWWTGEGITAKRFANDLEQLGNLKRLNIHINCLGGDCHTAQAIHSIIADYGCDKKTSYIDGVCASAATLIASAADEVVARHNTNYMIHFPWAVCIGNSSAMKKAAEYLEKLTVPIVSVYKEQVKGKIQEETIRKLMEEETWMTADEALEYGFVDKVRGKINAIARVNKSQIFCSGQLMNIAKYHYRNVPDYPFDDSKPKKEHKMANEHSVADPGHSHNLNSPGHMTRENLPPELLASIQAEARTAERKRLDDLDAMMAPGLESIIAKAKADGKQPNDIAMECLTVTREQLVSGQTVAALKRDGSAIGAVAAGDAPVVKPTANKGAKLLVDAFAKSKRGIKPATVNGAN
jgi:ATP-dependent protease ClpP protease subunit